MAQAKLVPTNIPGLFKNPRTKVLINENVNDYQKLLIERRRKKESEKLKEEVVSLKNEITELKTMLKEMLNG